MPTPLLAAPGVEILTTVPPQAYNFMSGSSLAAAHVTGSAALLLEREPGLSPAHVRDILRASARPVTSSGGTPQPAIGVVDAYAALERLLRVQAGSQGVEAHVRPRTTAAINPTSATIPPSSFSRRPRMVKNLKPRIITWSAHLSTRQHTPQGDLTGGDAGSLLGGLALKRGRTAAR